MRTTPVPGAKRCDLMARQAAEAWRSTISLFVSVAVAWKTLFAHAGPIRLVPATVRCLPSLASGRMIWMYHSILAATPVDRDSMPQDRLDISQRVRTNPLPWTGQFSPQLVEALLRAYASHGAVVLDPFVGSGTSLGEAARLGLAATGSDINPAAVALARLYGMANCPVAVRADILASLHERLAEVVPPDMPLFAGGRRQTLDKGSIERALVGLWRESPIGPARDIWAALVVLCDFFQQHLDVTTVHQTWARLERTIRFLPTSSKLVTIRQADARALPLESRSVDLILTSPPYINVHNYHQKFRRSVEALDCDILAIARCEIGSNRRNRGNRFLTVVQYALDMTLALREMVRVAKADARLILVLGRESTVRGTRFLNGELVAELAVDGLRLELERRQERVFRNRFGTNIFEDILHLRASGEYLDEDEALKSARGVARRVLSSTRPLVPQKAQAGLDQALARVDDVPASSMLPASALSQLAPP